MQDRRRLRQILSIFLLVPGFLMLQMLFVGPGSMPTASAHAFVIGSEPVDGSTIPVPPKSIRIFFDTTISSTSHADIISPTGQLVQRGPGYLPPNNPRELDTPLVPASQLQPGGYLIRWTAISLDDGHATQGSIGFNLGHSSTGLSGQTILGPTTSNILPQLDLLGSLAIAWDWLISIALTFWIGILVTEGLILTYVGEASNVLNQVRKQVRSLQWLSLSALLVGEAISLFLRTAQLNQIRGTSVFGMTAISNLLTSTNYAYFWGIRLFLILLAMFFLRHTKGQTKNLLALPAMSNPTPTRTGVLNHKTTSDFGRLRRQLTQEQRLNEQPSDNQMETASLRAGQRGYTVIWLILTAALLLTYALSSDAAQLVHPRISAIVLEWLYLAAQSVWFGTVAYMGYILLPALSLAEPDHHAATLVAFMRRVNPLLLSTLGIILVAGLFLTETSIQTPQQFLSDPYGRTMLVKWILLGIMMLFTLYNLFILAPRLTRQTILLPVVNSEMPARRARQTAIMQSEKSIKRSFSLLSWLGAAVLLCAAIMTFFAPPIVFPDINYSDPGSSNTTTNSTSNQPQTQAIGNLTATLQVLPAHVNSDNTVLIELHNKNGAAVTNAKITLNVNMQIMDMGTTTKAATFAKSSYTASFPRAQSFSMAGPWAVGVTIQVPGQAPVQTSFQVFLT
ncbi:MAG TPA: DUF4149 domain-containing protein [Ktedonobacteraceae bacterium]|nr:DUF4149 domain-containing protein [Ktedonobacteraceae bacterium]